MTWSLARDALVLLSMAESTMLRKQTLVVAKEILSFNHIYTSGVGKSGMVAQRFAATLKSVSVPATFTHATEWFHGDVGQLKAG